MAHVHLRARVQAPHPFCQPLGQTSLSSNSTLVIARHPPQAPHPSCPGNPQPLLAAFDLTATLRANTLDQSYCISNPSVLRLRDDVFLYTARAYQFAAGAPCRRTPLGPTPWVRNWSGQVRTVLAVVRHTLRDALPHTAEEALPDTGLAAGAPAVSVTSELLHWELVERPLLDSRLFHDDRGRVWLYCAMPTTPNGPRVPVVIGVSVHCPSLGIGFGPSSSQSGAALPQTAADVAAGVATGQVGASAEAAGGRRCSIQLRGANLLSYKRATPFDKHWVPWNGTTRMTYTAYPYFTAWHEVLDWVDYSDPPSLNDTAARPQRQPFFDQLRSYWGDLIALSGGTPAVLEAGSGSFLAVARAKAYAGCFHVGASAWASQMPPLGCSMTLTCDAFRQSIFAAVPSERPLFRDRIPFVPSFAYRPLDECKALNSSAAWEALGRAVEARNSSMAGRGAASAPPAHLPDLQAAAGAGVAALRDAAMDARRRKPVAHHQHDFLMVLYRFSAAPPYAITHLSPGFTPPTAVHSGVVFPLGLSRIAAPGGASGGQQHYLVSYGEDDIAARAMVMSEATVEALLRPVEDMLEGVPDFAACTLPAAHYQ